jgi:hypothetical protein
LFTKKVHDATISPIIISTAIDKGG